MGCFCAESLASAGLDGRFVVLLVVIVLVTIFIVVDVYCYFTYHCGILMCFCVNCCAKTPPDVKEKENMAPMEPPDPELE